MSLERTRRGTTVQSLQHRGFHLEEPAGLQEVAQGTHHLDADHRVLAGLFAHDQVRVAVANARIFTHLLVRHGQWAQGLGGHEPAIRHHGKLTALGGDDSTFHEDHVSHVHIGLPLGQRVFTNGSQRQHDLQRCSIAFLQRGESQLAGVADKHHTPGHAHDGVGLFPWR